MQKKVISSQKAYPSRSMGPHVKQVIPSAVTNVDPFVFLDHFGPFERQPNSQGVPPHPHAGIATITYLFSGSNRHQDSYGHDVVIHAGDLAWMQAGRGIIHAEGMNENKQTAEMVHGVQIWISLPAKDKFIEPDFFHFPEKEIPVYEENGIWIKVLCGTLHGIISPVKSLSPAYLFEVKMEKGRELTLPITDKDTCAVYLVNGEIQIAEKSMLPGTITDFETEGDHIEITAKEESHMIILGGTPLNEPIVGYASYVMNSEEQIRQVLSDYHNGKMGVLDIQHQ
jgi:hypothetical protein